MMAMFMVIIGVFTLYSAVTGKGPAFNNDYPKAMKVEANKLLRNFCWLIGPVAVVTGVLDYMITDMWPYWVSMGIIIPAIVVYVIIFRKRFKEYLKKK